jgi:hypothetical protein
VQCTIREDNRAAQKKTSRQLEGVAGWTAAIQISLLLDEAGISCVCRAFPQPHLGLVRERPLARRPTFPDHDDFLTESSKVMKVIADSMLEHN